MLHISILKQILHNWFINYVIIQCYSWPKIYFPFFKIFFLVRIYHIYISYIISHIFTYIISHIVQFTRIRVRALTNLSSCSHFRCYIYVWSVCSAFDRKGRNMIESSLESIRNRCNWTQEDEWKEESVSTAFFFQKAFQCDLNGGHASID